MAGGKCPDMRLLDAGACGEMEDAVEDGGATTPDEIRRAVKRAWNWKERITPDFCEATARAVWKNCGDVLRLKEVQAIFIVEACVKGSKRVRK